MTATSRYLVRGMLCGAVAGLAGFGFAHAFGEPQIGAAIAYETQRQVASGEPADPEIFSRAVQSGAGLLTAILVVGTALGGLFAIAFALVYGRVRGLGPRATAALIAALAFVTITLVPQLKYPANPPSVGVPATIGLRTELFGSMIAISLASLVLALAIGSAGTARFGRWNAWILAGAAYLGVIAAAQALLPPVDEVPATFSAVVLWQFRVASLETNAILWGAIGLLFGFMTERDARRASSARDLSPSRSS